MKVRRTTVQKDETVLNTLTYTYEGYTEPDTSLLIAVGLGIAKAIGSKQDHSRYGGCENDDGQVKSSKSCTFKNSKRESTH